MWLVFSSCSTESGIAAAILVNKPLYRGGVIFSPMYQFFFFFALDLLRDPRSFHR